MASVRLKVSKEERDGLDFQSRWNGIEQIPQSVFDRSPELVKARQSGVLKVWIGEQEGEFLWFDWFDRDGGAR